MKKIKSPRKILGLDFETFYSKDYTLKKLSTSRYIRNEQFKVHCMGVQSEEDKEPQVFYGKEIKRRLKQQDWKNTAVLAHHTHFDGLILSHHYGVVPAYYYCTLSMARARHGNGQRADLGALAQRYNIGVKKGEVLTRMRGISDPSEQLLADLGDYCGSDVLLMWHLFRLLRKGYPEPELDLIDATIRMFTDPILVVDRKRAQHELETERKIKSEKIRKAGSTLEELHSAEAFAQMLRDRGIDPPTKISKKTGKRAYAFARTDAHFLELAQHDSDEIKELVEARLAAKSTIGETRAAALLERSADGLPLPIYLNYARAHTLRWSGGDKFNPQNFPARNGDALRQCIMAPKGHKLVICDSAQIEARTNAWLAGEEGLLEGFRNKQDLYCTFASQMFKRTITKADTRERFIGKTCILGLGYQMGAPKLQYTLALGRDGPAVFMSMDECITAVQTYRSTYRKIVEQWWFMQGMISVMMSTKPQEYKCLTFRRGAVDVPNGLSMIYPGLRGRYKDQFQERIEYTYETEKGTGKIYGGLLDENIIQCLSRIIVGEQLLQLKDLYKVVMCTHDEIVLCVPDRKVKKASGDIVDVMRTSPAWCRELPLDAEVFVNQRYTKSK